LPITFFNNRLERTAFYPGDLDAYASLLRKSDVAVNFGQGLNDMDRLRQQTLYGMDGRLGAQLRKWLKRYA
jgi:hypothetical protein